MGQPQGILCEAFCAEGRVAYLGLYISQSMYLNVNEVVRRLGLRRLDAFVVKKVEPSHFSCTR
jgi:hypothetical protein